MTWHRPKDIERGKAPVLNSLLRVMEREFMKNCDDNIHTHPHVNH